MLIDPLQRDSIGIPYLWTDEEKSWLEGSQVEERMQDLESSLSDEFEQLKKAGWESLLPAGSFTFEVSHIHT
jgi:hypothetical protein